SAAAMGVGVCTTSFSGFLCTTNMYAAGQFRILQRRLQLSCANNNWKGVDSDADDSHTKLTIASTYAVLRDCIKQHQALILYMERVENLFSTIMLAQTLGSVLEICFSGFQILLVMYKRKPTKSFWKKLDRRTPIHFVRLHVLSLLYNFQPNRLNRYRVMMQESLKNPVLRKTGSKF
ncbi:hypothetical protein PV326_014074, partial [Microctonus aethiopoides]